MSTKATPLSVARNVLDRTARGQFIEADDARCLALAVTSLTQQLADLRAKPAGELYTHGYFGDRSRAGELAPGYGDKEPAPADDAELVKIRSQLSDALSILNPGPNPEDWGNYASDVRRSIREAITYLSRGTQQSAGADAEVEEIARWISKSTDFEPSVWFDRCRTLLRKLRAAQPARQPVTRGEYYHANEKEAALLNEWLRDGLSQENCDLMETLFRRAGLVYWDDPMRPKPEALLEGRV